VKWSLKYFLSCLARLSGADHNSTGSVVTWNMVRPATNAQLTTRPTPRTTTGWPAQKRPHVANVVSSHCSIFAPMRSLQLMSLLVMIFVELLLKLWSSLELRRLRPPFTLNISSDVLSNFAGAIKLDLNQNAVLLSCLFIAITLHDNCNFRGIVPF